MMLRLRLIAVLIVSLIATPALAQTLFPAKGARNVNPDAVLKLTFGQDPMIGKSGQIRIYDAATDKLVDTLDMSIPAGPTTAVDPAVRAANYIGSPYPYDRTARATNRTVKPGTGSAGAVATDGTKYQLTIIGGFTDGFHFYPVTRKANVATLHPHHDLLEYGKTYYVQVDPGVLTTPDGSFKGVIGKDWRFTTKARGPAPGTKTLTVAADGTGDFNTLQGAMDFIPDHSKDRVTVRVKKGLYEEIIYFRNKDNVTIQGEDPDNTVIRYANNEFLNPHPANYRTNELPGTFPSRRAAVTIDNSNAVHVINMTFQTTAPGQSEGLLMTGDRNILKNVIVSGGGDALQVNGRAYIVNSTIWGTGDTILGRGAVFFDRCTIKSTRVFMWIRNTDKNHGNVFKDCTFIGLADPTDIARAPTNGAASYPYAEAVLINTKMSGITPQGFGSAHTGGNIRFWEFNSTDLQGRPIDVSKRAPWSRQLDAVRDARIIADYSTPSYVLGGWTPELGRGP